MITTVLPLALDLLGFWAIWQSFAQGHSMFWQRFGGSWVEYLCSYLPLLSNAMARDRSHLSLYLLHTATADSTKPAKKWTVVTEECALSLPQRLFV